MTASGLFAGVGLSRYGVMARLRPALLVVLPFVPVVEYWFPQMRTTGGAAFGLLSACGVTYFMAQVARGRGRDLEERLGDGVGRRHSARLLTFTDETLARETKERYHSFLQSKGCRLSSVEEERDDPRTALERSRSAVDRLLVLTRYPKQDVQLLDETIAYGFTRNLRGLKPIAVVILILLAAANATLMAVNWHDRLALAAGAGIEGVLAASLAAWVFLVTTSSVRVASLSYARRFFERCEDVQ